MVMLFIYPLLLVLYASQLEYRFIPLCSSLLPLPDDEPLGGVRWTQSTENRCVIVYESTESALLIHPGKSRLSLTMDSIVEASLPSAEEKNNLSSSPSPVGLLLEESSPASPAAQSVTLAGAAVSVPTSRSPAVQTPYVSIICGATCARSRGAFGLRAKTMDVIGVPLPVCCG